MKWLKVALFGLAMIAAGVLSLIYKVTDFVTAFGTVLVCALAIWGEWLNNLIFGPRLKVTLLSEEGDPTTRNGDKKTIYWTIKIENARKSSLAKNVRVKCINIEKASIDSETQRSISLPIPVQLRWAFRDYQVDVVNIKDEDFCNLGFLDEDSETFELDIIRKPNNFKGYIKSGESMKVSFIAIADNFISNRPYTIDISWDGKWAHDSKKMLNHLIINEVNN